jgi:hypothetical protein
VSLAAIGVAAILLRHLQLAWRLLSRRSFTAYVLRQGALLIFYAISYSTAEAAHSAHRDVRHCLHDACIALKSQRH